MSGHFPTLVRRIEMRGSSPPQWAGWRWWSPWTRSSSPAPAWQSAAGGQARLLVWWSRQVSASSSVWLLYWRECERRSPPPADTATCPCSWASRRRPTLRCGPGSWRVCLASQTAWSSDIDGTNGPCSHLTQEIALTRTERNDNVFAVTINFRNCKMSFPRAFKVLKFFEFRFPHLECCQRWHFS